MTNLRQLFMALVYGMPPGFAIGFVVGYLAREKQLIERYLHIELGWGPKRRA